jgi:hypothetical protein
MDEKKLEKPFSIEGDSQTVIAILLALGFEFGAIDVFPYQPIVPDWLGAEVVYVERQ